MCLPQVPMVLRNDAYSSAFSAPSLSLSQSRKIAWIMFCGSMNSLRKRPPQTITANASLWLRGVAGDYSSWSWSSSAIPSIARFFTALPLPRTWQTTSTQNGRRLERNLGWRVYLRKASAAARIAAQG